MITIMMAKLTCCQDDYILAEGKNSYVFKASGVGCNLFPLFLSFGTLHFRCVV